MVTEWVLHQNGAWFNLFVMILIAILTVLLTTLYMKNRTVISTGPESEAHGCLGVFITMGLISSAIVAFGFYAIAWCIDFIIEHWLWFVIPLVAIILYKNKDSEMSKFKKPILVVLILLSIMRISGVFENEKANKEQSNYQQTVRLERKNQSGSVPFKQITVDESQLALEHVKEVTEVDADKAKSIYDIFKKCGFSNKDINNLRFDTIKESNDGCANLFLFRMVMYNDEGNLDLDMIKNEDDRAGQNKSVHVLLSKKGSIEKIYVPGLINEKGELLDDKEGKLYENGKILRLKKDYFVQNMTALKNKCIEILRKEAPLINNSHIKENYTLYKSPESMKWNFTIEEAAFGERSRLQEQKSGIIIRYGEAMVKVECNPETEEILHVKIENKKLL